MPSDAGTDRASVVTGSSANAPVVAVSRDASRPHCASETEGSPSMPSAADTSRASVVTGSSADAFVVSAPTEETALTGEAVGAAASLDGARTAEVALTDETAMVYATVSAQISQTNTKNSTPKITQTNPTINTNIITDTNPPTHTSTINIKLKSYTTSSSTLTLHPKGPNRFSSNNTKPPPPPHTLS